MKLSIVTTLYYSAPFLEEFHQRIYATVNNITEDYELIIVNDGSPDNALEIARHLYNQDPHVTVIDLSRNFGHHKAFMTGMQYAHGDLIFFIDCDLEEAPETLADFYAAFEQNDVDVVYGVQPVRHGSVFRRVSGRVYYWLYNRLTDYHSHPNLLMSRLMTYRYVQHLLEHREHIFSIEGLWTSTGYQQMPITVEKSYKGSSTYSLTKRLTLTINSITAFSNKPLIYIAYLGLLITIPSGLYIVLLIMQYLTGYTQEVDGWTSLIVSIWFLSGLIIFILGIIAIYLSVMFVEVKDRPYTIVREVLTHNQNTAKDVTNDGPDDSRQAENVF